jgi:O-antigen ligase
LLLYLCTLVMVLNLLLGGATRSGFLADAILQLAAIPLLLAALWRLPDARFVTSAKWIMRISLAFVLLPLFQLIPLPPRLWTALPNSALSVEAFELTASQLPSIGLTSIELPWAPISVTPRSTWLSALSMLPSFALFLGVIQLNHHERRFLSLVLLSIGVLGIFLGLLQVAQGPESPLRFFQITNPSEAVGFFANRNHYAAFLYALTLFAAAWAVNLAMTIGASPDRARFETTSILWIAASFTLLVSFIAAQAMARSRGGMGLTIIALCGAFALASTDPRRVSVSAGKRLLTGAVVVAIMFAIQFALYRILERFSADPMEDARIPFARNTIEAAQAYMPFGSGMGSFVSVYGLFEKPQDTIMGVYANRAHNDILEFWLEGGLAAVILMAAFAAWLLRRTVAVWRPRQHGKLPIDTMLARAATIVITLLIAHSCVDYPLRTCAVMTIMVYSCALLVEPPISESPSGK